MTVNFTVSPDFAPDRMSGWFYFNTWLQRKLVLDIHLELYDSFEQQRADIRDGKVDLIYANPYDASMLVRELGFSAVARPLGKRDEAVIVVAANSAVGAVEDLLAGCRVATTADPDVDTIGMIMLEPADLDATNLQKQVYDSHVLVVKALLKGQADVGFILKQSYEELSELIRSDLRVLVTSQISVVHHALLLAPGLNEHFAPLQQALLGMTSDDKGRGVLESMEIRGWEAMSEEQTEFMIDLIDTLID